MSSRFEQILGAYRPRKALTARSTLSPEACASPSTAWGNTNVRVPVALKVIAGFPFFGMASAGQAFASQSALAGVTAITDRSTNQKPRIAVSPFVPFAVRTQRVDGG